MRNWSDIIVDLEQELDPKRVKAREMGGKSFSYLEGYDMIDTANRIFGFDGWDAKPLGPVQRYEVGTRIDDRNHKEIIVCVYSVPYLCRFHGLLEDGSIHTIEKGDIGKNSTQSEAYQQHEMAISGCATDALKRSMRHLGNQFGNSLYDKSQDEPGVTATNSPAKTKTATKKASATKKTSVKENGSKKESSIDRALAYILPKTLKGSAAKAVQVPSSGKTIGEVMDSELGERLLVWIGGLRESPAKNPPFFAESEDEIKLQNAVSYVLLNKKNDILTDDEKKQLQERLKSQ